MKVSPDEAIISGIYGAFYLIKPIQSIEKKPLLAKPAGKLRLNKKKSNTEIIRENPFAVGDRVKYRLVNKNQQDELEATIVELLERKNRIRRAAYQRVQTLGANIDRVVIISAFLKPSFSSGFIDRVLVETANSKNIETIIVINKNDLNAKEKNKQDNERILYYQKLNYQVFKETLIKKTSRVLQKAITKGTTLFIGHSGVGKSTLLNSLAKKPIQYIGDMEKKGRHTTTNPFMFSLNSECHLIDSPGVREFGLQHLTPFEVEKGFIEFSKYSCKFENCLHNKEPDCEVKEAVATGFIAKFRYNSYLSILTSLQERFKTRKGNYWSDTIGK